MKSKQTHWGWEILGCIFHRHDRWWGWFKATTVSPNVDVDSFEWPEKQKPLLAVHGANVPCDKGWLLCWTWLAKHAESVPNHWFLEQVKTYTSVRLHAWCGDALSRMSNSCPPAYLPKNGEGCWRIEQWTSTLQDFEIKQCKQLSIRYASKNMQTYPQMLAWHWHFLGN